MPLRSQDPVLRHGAQLETESTLGEETGAMFSEALQSGPVGSLLRIMELDEAEDGLEQTASSRARFGNLPSQNRAPDSPLLSRDDAGQRVRDEGLESHLTIPDTGMRQRTLDILIDRKREELKRKTILDQSPGGGARVSARVAASFVGSLVDPSNVALAFVPVIGEARYASLLMRAGGIGVRTGVRAGVGAVEGVVGGAIAEPLNYMANTQQQADYDAYDSMRNIAGGAFFGVALHGGAGLFGDMIRPGKWSRSETGIPVSATGIASTPDAQQYDPTLLAVERERAIVLDRLAEGRPVTYEAADARAAELIAARLERSDPDTFYAKTKSGEFRMTDKAAVGAQETSEFGQLREVVAYDGDTQVGTLLYANDGTPPTIEVSPTHQRKGIATAMLKLAKERGGRLGDSSTGVSGKNRPGYRTDEGHAFRTGADEASVALRNDAADLAKYRETGVIPDTWRAQVYEEAKKLLGGAGETSLSKSVRDALAADKFGGIRPVVASLPGDVQQGMFRMAMAQALTGRPIDVTPGLFTHYGDIDSGVGAANANWKLTSGADEAAARYADEIEILDDTPEELEKLFAEESALVDRLYAAVGRKADEADVKALAGIDRTAKLHAAAADQATACLMGGNS